MYVSEGRNPRTIQLLESLARSVPGVGHVQSFIDPAYHRTSITLASRDQDGLQRAVLSVARAAMEAIDMRQHDAQHPRLGAVDHISCHPLTAEPLSSAASAAAAGTGGFARRVAETVSGELLVPAYCYGWARSDQRPLDTIRRRASSL